MHLVKIWPWQNDRLQCVLGINNPGQGNQPRGTKVDIWRLLSEANIRCPQSRASEEIMACSVGCLRLPTVGRHLVAGGTPL